MISGYSLNTQHGQDPGQTEVETMETSILSELQVLPLEKEAGNKKIAQKSPLILSKTLQVEY